MPRLASLKHLGLALALALSSGCATLIGNVEPVEEKSESYGVMDLSKADRDWSRLPASQGSEVSDVAYQSLSTASIISLNSACRATPETQPKDLQALTNLLFLGISDITQRTEKGVIVHNLPALETTILGKLNNEPMMLRTVVLRRGNCIYDLLYMARPRHFPRHETEFAQFIASLRLR